MMVGLLVLAAPVAARCVDAQLLRDAGIYDTSRFARDPGDLCDRSHTGYYWTVGGWFTGHETYWIYCDPTACPECSGGWRPVSVTIYLYWEAENTCSLTVSAGIEAVNLSNPDCAVPGSVIVASDPMAVGPFSPAGLWAVTIPLPEDAPIQGEPFFASLTFHDTCDQLPVIVTDEGPCDDCASWNDWGTGPQELCQFGFPGNVSIFATLECQGPSPVEPTTWTTIKSRYR